LSIDDFGTGFSSLSYLQRLPARYVKLDRGFVLALDEDDRAAVVVEGVVGIAHRLGMQVVAEWVETGRQLTQVAALGCDVIQGFYLGRPQPTDALPAYPRQTQRLDRIRQTLTEIGLTGCPHPDVLSARDVLIRHREEAANG
jgi:EAL domain-containing protein (putative c-di-GMP-specific phosphodiesterase class I)